MAWELTQVLGNPPHSLQDSTVNVVAAKIEPKVTCALIRQLNQICSFENLRHVKRVRRQVDSSGRSELSIILCLSGGCQNWMEDISMDVKRIVDTYQLSPFIAKVAKFAATSKEEWEEQCKFWPTSYHPPQNLDSISGLSDEELPSIYNHMKTAIQLAKLSSPGVMVANAAVIVNPSTMQIISTAIDQTCQLEACTVEKKCTEVRENIASPLPEATEINEDGNVLPSSSPISKCNDLNIEVSCINPWGWMKQRPSSQKPLPCGGGFQWHPLKHAPLLAIENAAERDRMLFPCSASSAIKLNSNGNLEHHSNNEPEKRLKMDIQDQQQSVHEECYSESSSEPTRPYLCTGFDIYLVWEPCTMCAMALVHQRIKRIFYTFLNPTCGALGSVYRLHGEKSLNHHYSVFRISVPEEYLKGLSNDCSTQGLPELETNVW